MYESVMRRYEIYAGMRAVYRRTGPVWGASPALAPVLDKVKPHNWLHQIIGETDGHALPNLIICWTSTFTCALFSKRLFCANFRCILASINSEYEKQLIKL